MMAVRNNGLIKECSQAIRALVPPRHDVPRNNGSAGADKFRHRMPKRRWPVLFFIPASKRCARHTRGFVAQIRHDISDDLLESPIGGRHHPRDRDTGAPLKTLDPSGKGDYPTIKPFNFFQEVVFSHIGKPYLIYTSRTWRLAEDANGEPRKDENGHLVRLEPLAVETGFWRPQPEGKVEVLLTHPTGITEIYLGVVSGTTVEMATDAVVRTESAKPYTAGHRLYGLVDSLHRPGEKDLAYAFDMAAMGQPLTPHLWAVLQWDWIE